MFSFNFINLIIDLLHLMLDDHVTQDGNMISLMRELSIVWEYQNTTMGLGDRSFT